MGIALSAPLQRGIRFLQIPLPPERCIFLASDLLEAESSLGLPCSACMTIDQGGFHLYSGGSVGTSLSTRRFDNQPTYLLVKAYQPLSPLIRMTELMTIHLR